VFEHFENDAGGSGPDSVNPGQRAVDDQVRNRALQAPDGGRGALVSPAALRGSLDPCEVPQRAGDRSVDIDGDLGLDDPIDRAANERVGARVPPE